AYNDTEGVTAEFNLNLLSRINRECGANFDLGGFRHVAVFDDARGRIEMRLVSERAQVVQLGDEGGASDSTTARFEAGEYIITEYSQKYALEGFTDLVNNAGWQVDQVWTDPQEWFAVFLL